MAAKRIIVEVNPDYVPREDEDAFSEVVSALEFAEIPAVVREEAATDSLLDRFETLLTEVKDAIADDGDLKKMDLSGILRAVKAIEAEKAAMDQPGEPASPQP